MNEDMMFRVLVTVNTEYHIRDNVCVAVRSRGAGAFFSIHGAIGRRVDGYIETHPRTKEMVLARRSANPKIGHVICFCPGGMIRPEDAMVTSAIVEMRPPTEEEIASYPSSIL